MPTNVEFCRKFELICNKFCFVLIYLHREMVDGEQRIDSVEQQLITSMTPPELNSYKDKLTDTLKRYRTHIETKREKWFRDLED